MKTTNTLLAAIVMMLLPLRGPAQTNTVPWFSLSSAFGMSSSSTNLVKSTLGEASYGETQGPNSSVTLGFLSDTLVNHYPLPIQLSFFNAKIIEEKNVRLDWMTVSEENNYGFYIQRADDTLNSFQTLQNGFIPGHGTTIQPHNYSYVDATPGRGKRWYRLEQVDLDGSLHYSERLNVETAGGANEGELPTALSLSQNYPNPFNPSTTIAFALPYDGRVSLEVYNTLGQKVAQLLDELMTAGYHSVSFDASQLASGVYICRMKSGGFVQSKRLVLVR